MHAGNIGLTIDRGTMRLAPAYDVVPAAVWEHADRELSLCVGTGVHIDEVNGRHLMDEAASWGVPAKIAARQIRTTLKAMLDALRELIENHAQKAGSPSCSSTLPLTPESASTGSSRQAHNH